jgi:hypothetical protein
MLLIEPGFSQKVAVQRLATRIIILLEKIFNSMKLYEFMNPPPLLAISKPSGKTFAHQAATASLLAPLLAILVSAASQAAGSQASRIAAVTVGLVSLLFIVAGLIMGIVGLCGIKQNGPRGILGKSVAGLLINGLLLTFFMVGLVIGVGRSFQFRQFTEDLTNTVADMQAGAKQSYDSKNGITNVDFKSMQRLQNQFADAAQTMSGDDALISKAMARYVARMQDQMKKYEDAVTEVRTAKVLDLASLSDREQISTRREVVQNFIAANDEVKVMITNSEDFIRADLTDMNVSSEKIDQVIAGFDVKFAQRSVLDLQIRACDDRMGQGTLAMLDLLETNWGKWNYDPAKNVINFEDTYAQRSYRLSLNEIKNAGMEQVKEQGELVNLPQ